jgi:hypothetical protein
MNFRVDQQVRVLLNQRSSILVCTLRGSFCDLCRERLFQTAPFMTALPRVSGIGNLPSKIPTWSVENCKAAQYDLKLEDLGQ